MEDGVPKPEAFLAGAESPEVLCCLGDNMGKKLDGDGAQWLAVTCHFEEHPGVSVSGVFLNSGHLGRGDTRGVSFSLACAALTLSEGLLEGFSYFRGFELGCQLLHYTVAVWEDRGKDDKQEDSQKKKKTSIHMLAQSNI